MVRVARSRHSTKRLFHPPPVAPSLIDGVETLFVRMDNAVQEFQRDSLSKSIKRSIKALDGFFARADEIIESRSMEWLSKITQHPQQVEQVSQAVTSFPPEILSIRSPLSASPKRKKPHLFSKWLNGELPTSPEKLVGQAVDTMLKMNLNKEGQTTAVRFIRPQAQQGEKQQPQEENIKDQPCLCKGEFDYWFPGPFRTLETRLNGLTMTEFLAPNLVDFKTVEKFANWRGNPLIRLYEFLRKNDINLKDFEQAKLGAMVLFGWTDEDLETGKIPPLQKETCLDVFMDKNQGNWRPNWTRAPPPSPTREFDC